MKARKFLEAISLNDNSIRRVIEITENGDIIQWKKGVFKCTSTLFAKESIKGNGSIDKILEKGSIFDLNGFEYSLSEAQSVDIERNVGIHIVMHPLVQREFILWELKKLKAQVEAFHKMSNSPEIMEFMVNLNDQQNQILLIIGDPKNKIDIKFIEQFRLRNNELVNNLDDDEFEYNMIPFPKTSNGHGNSSIMDYMVSIFDSYKIPLKLLNQEGELVYNPANGWNKSEMLNEILDNTWIKNEAFEEIKHALKGAFEGLDVFNVLKEIYGTKIVKTGHYIQHNQYCYLIT